MPCMNPPTPKLSIHEDVKEKCCACQQWATRGYWYADEFICEDCATDGDALAMLAWKLAQSLDMSLYLRDEDFEFLQRFLTDAGPRKEGDGMILETLWTRMEWLESRRKKVEEVQ